MLNDWFRVLWALFVVVWLVGAMGAKRTVRREPFRDRMVYGGLMAVAFGLLFQSWYLGPPEVPAVWGMALGGLILTGAGLAFAIWARLTLGRNWSGRVTIKQDHSLVREGPYRIVRHPIYTGVLLAMLGTAIGFGRPLSLLGVPIAFAAFWNKARTEEQFMTERFGAQYVQYEREVKAFIPGLF
jgi:protein-S-isoprenylcysteine O-methyltransferase Ste14